MKPLQIKNSDSLERKVIANILRRREMPLTSFSDKLNDTLEEDAPFFTTRSRVDRAVNMSRLTDLFSLVGHNIVIVPVGATVTVSVGDKAVSETAHDNQALLFAGNEDGASIESHPIEVEAHWGRSE
ncbi:hypothetical protein LJC63_09345 [Ruminococcaceae bacterium OttesenSCG-928-L11]|nr:hypothetical protein [Ruminococcaceae bacterium OttesenSCG-928-L11]